MSSADAAHAPLLDEDWAWLTENLNLYLKKIDRSDLFDLLAAHDQWRLVRAKTPHEKITRSANPWPISTPRSWDMELGRGGLVGDLTAVDRSPIRSHHHR